MRWEGRVYQLPDWFVVARCPGLGGAPYNSRAEDQKYLYVPRFHTPARTRPKKARGTWWDFFLP